ncbi:P1 family peptidase [Pseudoteredinibacter isoporae]|uniref:L-aminopeptidase/D-esterase-like protein n=1 Tax=Pseudoteredinibacter isoporae TaxID=570281 RepID=A0A7X0JTZ1_9GAMM|nr:P1 family peptidase [Pseudoteredinibacter isoporae]MBB6522222.1 L-aminopeptidase/D-esterase-like protein [Pseudoteredinibacter isoporae]NHO87756.1 peptidase S58 DmpA [Pseudoteredinibacter isoporae]NIB23913.1 peptidase S58 DmpA [Pseudoteredinibacter isoporae]
MRFAHAMPILMVATAQAEVNPQADLTMKINAPAERTLTFDWPILRVGTGEYPAGPTGVTVFHFDKKVSVAVDSRGGGPGTVNAPYMELGYDMAELDSIVFAGGSWYGLEATTAVASALKDDGLRDGDAFAEVPNIAMSVGSIIFDFGGRRLNEIYPDKRLAQAAFRAAKTGQFPLGAQGAGRSAISGGLFGCHAHSGQGGAYAQYGDVKIATFTVVNALGVINDRDGNVVACYGDKDWPEPLKTKDLLHKWVSGAWPENDFAKKNTTISLVVTNQALDPAELKRLAVQVHTSMGRALQPFGTIYDGDVLYAVSTQELEKSDMAPVNLGVAASELMWDAILSAVPEQPQRQAKSGQAIPSKLRKDIQGEYQFGPGHRLKISQKGERLFATASGEKSIYAFDPGKDTELFMTANGRLTVPGRYPLVLALENQQLIINPGPWQQVATKQP